MESLSQRMADDWNQRAAANSMYYVDATHADWDPDEFFRAGQRDVDCFTSDFFATVGFDPSFSRMLEIGCGIGRMTHAFARMFEEVYATDISVEMLEQAAQALQSFDNVHLDLGSGLDLSEYPDDFFDFCFSYIVFPHIPSAEVVYRYVAEIGRVLRPGGICKFHVSNSRWWRITRGYWHIRKLLWSNFGILHVPILDKSPEIEFTVRTCETWAANHVSCGRIESILKDAGVTVSRLTGLGTKYMWVEGIKRLDAGGRLS